MGYQPPWVDRYGGSAVATRWSHEVLEVLDLRLTDALDVPWATMAVKVPIPQFGGLLFIGCTTSWRLDAEAARERQVVAPADLDARHRVAAPTIIAGDFNATPDAASIRFLTGRQALQGRNVHYDDVWEVATDGPGYTWTSTNPAPRAEIDQIVGQPDHHRRLDHIFIGSWHAHPDVRCRIDEVALVFNAPVDGLWPSDHFGVLARLDVENLKRG